MLTQLKAMKAILNGEIPQKKKGGANNFSDFSGFSNFSSFSGASESLAKQQEVLKENYDYLNEKSKDIKDYYLKEKTSDRILSNRIDPKVEVTLEEKGKGENLQTLIRQIEARQENIEACLKIIKQMDGNVESIKEEIGNISFLKVKQKKEELNELGKLLSFGRGDKGKLEKDKYNNYLKMLQGIMDSKFSAQVLEAKTLEDLAGLKSSLQHAPNKKEYYEEKGEALYKTALKSDDLVFLLKAIKNINNIFDGQEKEKENKIKALEDRKNEVIDAKISAVESILEKREKSFKENLAIFLELKSLLKMVGTSLSEDHKVDLHFGTSVGAEITSLKPSEWKDIFQTDKISDIKTALKNMDTFFTQRPFDNKINEFKAVLNGKEKDVMLLLEDIAANEKYSSFEKIDRMNHVISNWESVTGKLSEDVVKKQVDILEKLVPIVSKELKDEGRKLLDQLDPSEIMQEDAEKAFADSNKGPPIPTSQMFIKNFNEFSGKVSDSIKNVSIAKMWMKLANECFEVGNIHFGAAIYFAFKTPEAGKIMDLITKEKESEGSKLYAELTTKFHPSFNFKALRGQQKELFNQGKIVVPHFVFYAKDITSLGESTNKDYVQEEKKRYVAELNAFKSNLTIVVAFANNTPLVEAYWKIYQENIKAETPDPHKAACEKLGLMFDEAVEQCHEVAIKQGEPDSDMYKKAFLKERGRLFQIHQETNTVKHLNQTFLPDMTDKKFTKQLKEISDLYLKVYSKKTDEEKFSDFVKELDEVNRDIFSKVNAYDGKDVFKKSEYIATVLEKNNNYKKISDLVSAWLKIYETIPLDNKESPYSLEEISAWKAINDELIKPLQWVLKYSPSFAALLKNGSDTGALVSQFATIGKKINEYKRDLLEVEKIKLLPGKENDEFNKKLEVLSNSLLNFVKNSPADVSGLKKEIDNIVLILNKKLKEKNSDQILIKENISAMIFFLNKIEDKPIEEVKENIKEVENIKIEDSIIDTEEYESIASMLQEMESSEEEKISEEESKEDIQENSDPTDDLIKEVESDIDNALDKRFGKKEQPVEILEKANDSIDEVTMKLERLMQLMEDTTVESEEPNNDKLMNKIIKRAANKVNKSSVSKEMALKEIVDELDKSDSEKIENEAIESLVREALNENDKSSELERVGDDEKPIVEKEKEMEIEQIDQSEEDEQSVDPVSEKTELNKIDDYEKKSAKLADDFSKIKLPKKDEKLSEQNKKDLDEIYKAINDPSWPFPGYLRVSGKVGGANDAGLYGGQHVKLEKQQNGDFVIAERAMFKQDTKSDKVRVSKIIGEYAVGELIQVMVPDKDKFAKIELVNAKGTIGDTYVKSIFIENYRRDFFKAAYLAAGHNKNKVDKMKKPMLWLKKSNSSRIINNYIIDGERKKNIIDYSIDSSEKYINNGVRQFAEITAVRLLLNDNGVHSGNFGVREIRDKTLELVAFDFGTGFYKLNTDFDPYTADNKGLNFADKFYKYYFLEFDDKIIKSPAMAAEFIRLGNVNKDKIKNQVEKIINTILEKYGQKEGVWEAFAKHVGSDKSTPDGIKAFIIKRLSIRQDQMLEVGKELDAELRVKQLSQPTAQKLFKPPVVTDENKESIFNYLFKNITNKDLRKAIAKSLSELSNVKIIEDLLTKKGILGKINDFVEAINKTQNIEGFYEVVQRFSEGIPLVSLLLKPLLNAKNNITDNAIRPVLDAFDFKLEKKEIIKPEQKDDIEMEDFTRSFATKERSDDKGKEEIVPNGEGGIAQDEDNIVENEKKEEIELKLEKTLQVIDTKVKTLRDVFKGVKDKAFQEIIVNIVGESLGSQDIQKLLPIKKTGIFNKKDGGVDDEKINIFIDAINKAKNVDSLCESIKDFKLMQSFRQSLINAQSFKSDEDMGNTDPVAPEILSDFIKMRPVFNFFFKKEADYLDEILDELSNDEQYKDIFKDYYKPDKDNYQKFYYDLAKGFLKDEGQENPTKEQIDEKIKTIKTEHAQYSLKDFIVKSSPIEMKNALGFVRVQAIEEAVQAWKVANKNTSDPKLKKLLNVIEGYSMLASSAGGMGQVNAFSDALKIETNSDRKEMLNVQIRNGFMNFQSGMDKYKSIKLLLVSPTITLSSGILEKLKLINIFSKIQNRQFRNAIIDTLAAKLKKSDIALPSEIELNKIIENINGSVRDGKYSEFLKAVEAIPALNDLRSAFEKALNLPQQEPMSTEELGRKIAEVSDELKAVNKSAVKSGNNLEIRNNNPDNKNHSENKGERVIYLRNRVFSGLEAFREVNESNRETYEDKISQRHHIVVKSDSIEYKAPENKVKTDRVITDADLTKIVTKMVEQAIKDFKPKEFTDLKLTGSDNMITMAKTAFDSLMPKKEEKEGLIIENGKNNEVHIK